MMITVNSVSGGKTSAYIAVHYPADYNIFSLVCIDDPKCAPKDKHVVDYVNNKLSPLYTGQYGGFIATAEDDATLTALMDLEQLLGKEIIWVRGGSFDDIVDGKSGYLPSVLRRYCTDHMKMRPIFEWWFRTIGVRCNMRIGFRADEFDRMERFFNNQNPTIIRYPVSCSLTGEKRQKLDDFNWRYCSFPLIKDGIRTSDVNEYWKQNGFVGGNLFEERRQIKFPIISNCVGCFHKKVDTLSIMSNLHREKMEWFSKQEEKDKGTWLDSRVTYRTIIDNSENWLPEMLKESGASCDSGGCHD